MPDMLPQSMHVLFGETERPFSKSSRRASAAIIVFCPAKRNRKWTLLCDRFMGTFKTIALLVLSPANTSEYKKSNVKDTNIIKRKNKAMIVIAPSSLFCILTSNILCIPWKQVIIRVLEQTELQRKPFTFTPLLSTGNVSSVSDAKGRTSVATSRNHFH